MKGVARCSPRFTWAEEYIIDLAYLLGEIDILILSLGNLTEEEADN